VLKPDKLLLDALHQGMKARYHEKEREREGNAIHASSLIDFCPREYALCMLGKVMYNASKPATIAQMMTYDIGRKIEKIVLQSFDAAHILEKRGIFTIPASMFGYPITGAPDAWVRLHPSWGIYTVEIKSIKPEEFDILTEAKVVHECQLSLYLWFAELCKTPGMQVKEGLLLYACKTQKNMPHKVFLTQRNDAFLQRVQSQLQELKTFSKKKKLPERMCNSPQALMARRPCKCVQECFAE
jgi:hypothetical protein